MDLAYRLKWRRKQLGLTQAQLAEQSSTTQQLIQQLETRKVLTTGKLLQFAEALGVRPQWLESGEAPMTESITPDEREMLEAYRTMNKEEQDAYRLLLRSRRKERIIVIEQPPIPAANLVEDQRRTA
ncbi:MAG: helix-turn-helix domain-containing protein [Candidatus Competibacter sp.]